MAHKDAPSTHRMIAGGFVLILLLWAPMVFGQAASSDPDAERKRADEAEDISPASERVDILPAARDEQIRERLQRVLEATGWYESPGVEVNNGIVFLNGVTETEALKRWAGDLARNTQDVVAVVNRIDIAEADWWDMGPAMAGLMRLWRQFIRALPFVFFGLLVLTFSLGMAILASRWLQSLMCRRIKARLLRKVLARGAGALVFLFGTYIVLRVSGLTQLAMTIVGGTGLIGLALGIAFRDITENFLASIFLSIQRPFEPADLVDIDGILGYVQQLNIRTTTLMTLDGNIVQIPNATVYKTKLRNYTTNVNRREDFVIGIGYEDSISEAQAIALKVLEEHPAVLNDPEPSVLADSLGASTINLRVYFWLNGKTHSWLKVRSSVIRMIKVAFQAHEISMPDEAREIVFPKGIPVTMQREQSEPSDLIQTKAKPKPPAEPDVVSTKAEAGLYSEAGVIEEQARNVQPLKQGENLLKPDPDPSS